MPARLRTGVLPTLAALAVLLVLAGCGGSSKPRQSGSHKNVMLALSACMRAHGVSRFPDPNGRGINLEGTGIDPQAPAFRDAQRVCFKLLPGGGPMGRKASAQQIAQARSTAQCMREHGVSGFPDPIISQRLPTGLDQANYSSIVAGNGMIVAIPKSVDETSPAFRKAANACRFRG